MIAEKASNIATQGGAGVAVLSGGNILVERVMGLTPAQWSVAGVIGGLLIGLAGLIVSTYFQWRRSQR